jgi:GNAT superfamily N-acetyltransferase
LTVRSLPWPLKGEGVVVAEGAAPGEFTIWATDEAIGSGALSVDGDTLRIERLCINPKGRGYGAGSEAARLLLDAAAGAGMRRVRAHAPPDLGLAVYFWIRMGLRPLHGDGPEGGIWFEAEPGEVSRAWPGSGHGA